MPFLAAVPAAVGGIGSLLGAGLGAAAPVIGSALKTAGPSLLQYGLPLAGGIGAQKLLLGPSDEEKAALDATTNVLNTQQQALQSGIDTAESLTPTAADLMGRVPTDLDSARSSYGSALDFWTPILSGDMSAMTSLLSPEIGRIGTGYQQATEQAARTLPRGGYRSSVLANLPFQQATDVSNLYAGLRPQAASAVADIGSKQADLGLGTGALGSNLYNSILSALSQSGAYAGITGRSLLDYGTNARQVQYNQGSEIGGLIADIIQSLKLGGGKSVGGYI